jgi:hypothetical protein
MQLLLLALQAAAAQTLPPLQPHVQQLPHHNCCLRLARPAVRGLLQVPWQLDHAQWGKFDLRLAQARDQQQQQQQQLLPPEMLLLLLANHALPPLLLLLLLQLLYLTRPQLVLHHCQDKARSLLLLLLLLRQWQQPWWRQLCLCLVPSARP